MFSNLRDKIGFLLLTKETKIKVMESLRYYKQMLDIQEKLNEVEREINKNPSGYINNMDSINKGIMQ